MNELARQRLRVRIDLARRAQFEAAKQSRREPQTPARVAATKAILAAHRGQLSTEPVRVIACLGSTRYLLSVGEGLARVLDLGFVPARLSKASDVYDLVARGSWSAFEGNPARILAIAAPLTDGAP